MSKSISPQGDDVVQVRVPFSIRKRGGRKLVVVPAGTLATPARSQVDNAMVKALARAFRWRKLLETGAYGTIEELAAAGKINPSYVSRILRMTLLAPHIVEAILDGEHSPQITLATLMEPFPQEWRQQRQLLQPRVDTQCSNSRPPR
jgi:AraC-like DNA-binding protein